MRNTVLVIALALLAGLGGFVAYRAVVPGGAAVTDRTVPPIRFIDVDGQAHLLSDLRGKWVLLNFWASWCAPCMDELPLIIEAQKRYAAHGLQILGPALDDRHAVLGIVRRFGINYPVTADFAGADAAMQALGNEKGALPYTVLIDPDGIVRDIHLGGMTREVLDALLRPVRDATDTPS